MKLVGSNIARLRTTAEIRQRLRQVNAAIQQSRAVGSGGRVPPLGDLLAERERLEHLLAARRAERAKPVVSFGRWRDGFPR